MDRDEFSSCHPFVNLIYFVFVIGFALAFTHPVCLGISFLSAFIYSVMQKGSRGIRKNLIYMLPMLIFTIILNPAFSHQGVTILTYLPSGNTLNLESIIYGIVEGFVLISVICWFSCFNQVMTSDKFVYLFGKAAPVMSLILSMTLRFVPEFINRFKVVYRAQKAAGMVSLASKFRTGINVFSSVVTWALERAIVTADSMKSRGYGLEGRTAYTLFRFDRRDKVCLLYICFLSAYIIWSKVRGAGEFLCYPMLKISDFNILNISAFGIYFMLAAMPVFMNLYYINFRKKHCP